MKSATVSAKLEPSIAEKLDLLAKATARSRSFLVAEAIETYVKNQAWQIQAIQEGIQEADKGNIATDEKIEQVFQKWGANEG